MPNAKRLLILCPESSPARQELPTLVQEMGPPFTSRTATLRNLLTNAELSSDVFGSVFDCDVLGQEELTQVLTISEATERRPILITARQIALSSYRQVDTLENIVALQKPFSSAVFHALIQKASSGEAFKPTVCPRFITDQPVRLILMKTGHLIATRMRNYSAGGAFLEYRGISIAVGDRVALALEDVQEATQRRHLQLLARVVWVRDGQSGDQLRGVGLQFIQSTPHPSDRTQTVRVSETS